MRKKVIFIAEKQYLPYYRPFAQLLYYMGFYPLWVTVDGTAPYPFGFFDAARIMEGLLQEIPSGNEDVFIQGRQLDIDALTLFEKKAFGDKALFKHIYSYTMHSVRSLPRARRLASAWCHVTRALIAKWNPYAFFVWNGRYLPYRAVQETCKASGVSVFTNELGWIPGTILLDQGALSDTTADLRGRTWDLTKGTPDEMRRADAFLRDYTTIRGTMVSSGKRCDPRLLRGTLGRKKGNFLVLYACQVDWDTNIAIGARRFTTNAGAVVFLLKSLALMPDAHLLVKIHPLDREKTKQAENLRCLLGERGDIVSDYHIHDLIQAVDCVATRNSTVGFEALCYGKPLVLLEQAKYADPAFVHIPKGEQDAIEVFLSIRQKQGHTFAMADFKRFIIHLLDNYLVPLEYDYLFKPETLALLRHFANNQSIRSLHTAIEAKGMQGSSVVLTDIEKRIAAGRMMEIHYGWECMFLEKLKGALENVMSKRVAAMLKVFVFAFRRTFQKKVYSNNPGSTQFGAERGTVIDRYFIEKFLAYYSSDVRGAVLEIGDNNYTVYFGGVRVSRSEVLNLVHSNPNATIVADLTSAENIPSNSFDCIILTQVLQCIYDVHAAVKTVYRILRPGGVVLATCHGISQISRYDMVRWGEYWRFTTLSARRLFEEVFRGECIQVRAYGNVAVACAFLQGLSREELNEADIEYFDPNYEVVITIRAEKTIDIVS